MVAKRPANIRIFNNITAFFNSMLFSYMMTRPSTEQNWLLSFLASCSVSTSACSQYVRSLISSFTLCYWKLYHFWFCDWKSLPQFLRVIPRHVSTFSWDTCHGITFNFMREYFSTSINFPLPNFVVHYLPLNPTQKVSVFYLFFFSW
jgi:hypothetical protein